MTACLPHDIYFLLLFPSCCHCPSVCLSQCLLIFTMLMYILRGE